MEGTEDPVQRYAIDTVRMEFDNADSEPPAQLQQAFSIIENACKTSSAVWVNKQHCKLMADSFNSIAEELKVWRTILQDSKNLHPILDKLLTVLRKGESLVWYYTTWNGRVSSLIDSQEAMFRDIIEELDTIKAQLQDLEATSGIDLDMMKLDIKAQDANRCYLLTLELDFCTIRGLWRNKLCCLSIQGSDRMHPQDFFDSQPGSVSNEHCVTVPLSFRCEIFLLELGKGMAHLHGRDLESANVRLVCFDSTTYKGSRGHDCCEFGFMVRGWSSKHGNVYIFGILSCIQVLKRNYMPKNTTSSICEEQEKSLMHFCDDEEWTERGRRNHSKLISIDLADDLVDDLDEDLHNPGIRNGIEETAIREYSAKFVEEEAPRTDVNFCAPRIENAIKETGICENSSKLVEEDEAPINDAPEADSMQIVRDRIRNRVWSHDESLALLEVKEEAMRMEPGSDWNYVSESLFDEFGFDRASISCQQQWDALLHSFRTILDHEAAGCGQSYWKMNEGERAEKHLHTTFESDWFEVMERIHIANPAEEETRIFTVGPNLGAFQSRVNYFGYANCEDDEIDSQSKESNQSLEETVFETISGEDESPITSRIAPFLNKRVDDALKPLVSVLRRQEENEQKHRRELLAIEEAKLALKREKLELRRRALTVSCGIK